jgi:type II secretion system protein I
VLRDRSGVTLVEVMVGLVVFTVGVLALMGSWAAMSRSVGRGRHATVAAMIASGRLHWLSRVAGSASPSCSGADWRDGTADAQGATEAWQILDRAGVVRRVQVIVRHRTPTGLATDTVASAVLCLP